MVLVRQAVEQIRQKLRRTLTRNRAFTMLGLLILLKQKCAINYTPQ